ncbi:cell division cycle protein 27 homolog B isoform X1 [Elaeis guineensis]|uniref:Cell division cycle protein 27 homolog B isoform X1 n=2 Tax=Elaeis guineensis var. tenera TaxID=51953 RepID=A0A6I9QQX3_ELAGV|nr:cell division cycle protein 27 homolog B isoform X1 [Elaeis guineensis]
METLMVDRVQSSLRLFMYRNALFLCERLCAEFPSELNLQLLATCYLRNNQAYCAYHILKGSKMPQSRYLFAISCFQMNLLREAETALCPANEPNAEVPNGAAGHYLLGLIYRYTGRRTCAVDHFMQALAIDPLLWAAYEELCILGAAEEASECFNDAAAFRVQQQQLSESSSQNLTIGTECQSLPSSMALGSGDTSPRHSKQLHANNTRETLSHPHGTVMVAGHPPIGGPSNISQYYTPPAVTQLSGVAPPPLCRNAQLYLNAIGGDGYTKSNVNAVIQAPRRKFVDEGKLRKVSGRLFSDSGTRRSTRLSGEAAANTNSNASQLGGNGANHFSAKSLGGLSSSSSKTNSAVLRSVTLRRGQSWANENFDEGRRSQIFYDSCADNTVTTSSMSALADGKCLEQDKMGCGISAHDSRLASGIREFLGLLRTLGEGYRLSCLYRSQEALEVYLRLSQHQFNTGWVLSQVGKAHFELVDYFEADRFFDLARRVSPYTLEGMDIYSTVLYHLEEEMKLSYLAQELISVDRLSPQAWCAMGNCYSLQKDHETAVKNFQRAVHVDSRFAYAHTLCGHEYVALEDFENGIKCYQSALQVDERHYNAWYGLGVVYLRQEKFEFAEHHFRKAFHINPCSSVLMCYLGMALHSLKRDEEALEIMEKAISADKKNPLPMYQKANILSSLERFDEALKELEQLKEYAPRESSVYALMGKIYKRLNVHEKAMFYFGIALDLKPPAADVATIKSAMEKLYLPDELEDTL